MGSGESFNIFLLDVLSTKIDSSNLGTSKAEEVAAKNIQLEKYVAPVLKSLRDPPDNPEEYKAEFGTLGPLLHQYVVRARQQSGSKGGGSGGSAPATSQPKETKLTSPGVMLPTPAGVQLQQQPGLGQLQPQQPNRVFVVSAQQQQNIRMAAGATPGTPGVQLLPQQMMMPQQPLQRQFQPGQNNFQ